MDQSAAKEMQELLQVGKVRTDEKTQVGFLAKTKKLLT